MLLEIFYCLILSASLNLQDSNKNQVASTGVNVFIEKSVALGLNYTHSIQPEFVNSKPYMMTGGFAIADVNGDDWDDLFVVTGAMLDSSGQNLNPNKLYLADQQGGYVERASEFGLNPNDLYSSGPILADFDGDGWRDLIIGGAGADGKGVVRYYHNNAGISFIDQTINSGLPQLINYSTSATDIDNDGDLDLSFTHWESAEDQLLWENNGAGQFTDITAEWSFGISHLYTFTASFANLNNDLMPDLMVASDFGHSNYFHNAGTVMVQQDQNHLTDQNGMGAAIGDYDNDGDLDWFVTSIYQPSQGQTGNRLYRNDGNGLFTDVSLAAGVQDGAWGWGACFADFNNDGWLDIYHTNGFPVGDFINDEAKLFISQGDGTFQESAQIYQVADAGMGRAVLCFDHNRDGKVDILVNNSNQDSLFLQNNLATENHFILIKLISSHQNMDAIGARIELTLSSQDKLIRDVMIGNNFLSSLSTTQHFGVGKNQTIDSIQVSWPSGLVTEYQNIAVDQLLSLYEVEEIFMHGFE